MNERIDERINKQTNEWVNNIKKRENIKKGGNKLKWKALIKEKKRKLIEKCWRSDGGVMKE